MNFIDHWRSLTNFWLWKGRNVLAFKRSGYTEHRDSPAEPQGVSLMIEQKYNFAKTREKLFTLTAARNLATLWYLDQMFEDFSWPEKITLVEPGCQDFARLPAWRSFFKKKNVAATITGVELDPFPILRNFHSRWDIAHYYISLENDGSRYEAGDFFNYRKKADMIFCFYPFVSANPALAWGLPAEFASAEKWLESFSRVLEQDGHVLVGHQGEWEENDFDRARNSVEGEKRFPLQLLERKKLSCPFLPPQFPFHMSLYKKIQAP